MPRGPSPRGQRPGLRAPALWDRPGIPRGAWAAPAGPEPPALEAALSGGACVLGEKSAWNVQLQVVVIFLRSSCGPNTSYTWSLSFLIPDCVTHCKRNELCGIGNFPERRPNAETSMKCFPRPSATKQRTPKVSTVVSRLKGASPQLPSETDAETTGPRAPLLTRSSLPASRAALEPRSRPAAPTTPTLYAVHLGFSNQASQRNKTGRKWASLGPTGHLPAGLSS